MEVILNNGTEKTDVPSAVTVGTFDGVHMGHMKIIDTLIDHAQSDGYQSILVTFKPHPQQVVKRDDRKVLLLTSIEEKLQILRNTGLNKIVIVPFTTAFSQIEYKEFLSLYLIEKLNMKKFVLGYDAALGRDRKGHLQQIEEHASHNNYRLDIVSPFKVDGIAVNSTLIRRTLQNGDCEKAVRYLGRTYSIQGTVVHGDHRGTGMGFPTANIVPVCADKLVPKDGVYAARVHFDHTILPGMVNIGFRPTFHAPGTAERTLEVYVFEFEGNLYQQSIRLEFIRYIRDEFKFKTKEELIKQLKKDEEKCKEILYKEEK